MDERQKSAVSAAMAKVLVILYIGVVIVGVMKFVTNFRIVDCLWEMATAVAVPLLVLLFTHRRKRTVFPMSLAGLAISPDRTKEAKRGRVKAYLLDSLQFSLTMTAIQVVWAAWQALRANGMRLSVWSDVLRAIPQWLGDCGVCFIVFLALDTVLYEWKSRRYCRENQEDLI